MTEHIYISISSASEFRLIVTCEWKLSRERRCHNDLLIKARSLGTIETKGLVTEINVKFKKAY